MNIEKIADAMEAASRFQATAGLAMKRLREDEYAYMIGSPETAACKRASMDLTRALARMRKL